MASKKGDENLKDKLKNIFRFSKEKAPSVTFQRPSTKEFVFTAEILKDIGPESPANNRIRTIKELADVVLKKKLEENAIEALWCSIQDLVLPQALPDNRRAALQFLKNLLEGQLQNLGILRAHFFSVIQSLTLPEILAERFELFKILSENGRTLTEFEEDAGPFLLHWMPQVAASNKITEFLTLLISVVKFNAAYLEEDTVSGFVKQTCILASQARSDTDTKLCLEVLDAVICYSYLPSECLQHFVAALCSLVNISKYCAGSWELLEDKSECRPLDREICCLLPTSGRGVIQVKLMRKLLGTHLGHSGLYTLCLMLQDRSQPPDHNLMRGAVFYIGMALWSFKKVPTLKHTPAAVLPSFLHVLSCGSPVVAHEIILSVQRLVKKYGKDLTNSTWDLILEILETILKQIENTFVQPFDPRISVDLHEILTSIENLHEQGQFAGTVDRFFKIIELCATKRPEKSVNLLIQHHAQFIHPGKENWISCLYQLLDKYFRQEKRSAIRIKALDVLSLVLSINKHMYEDELINQVVLPLICHIEADCDVTVRKMAVEILLSLAQTCSPVCFMDVIDIVEKTLHRPLVGRMLSPYPSLDSSEVIPAADETHLSDVKNTISLLTDLFKTKLYAHPPGLCLKVYDMLVNHVVNHYTVPKDYTSITAGAIRKTVIGSLLQLRSDGFHRLGIFDRANDSPLQYSPYVSCKKREASEMSPPGSPVAPGNQTAGQSHWFSITHLEYSRSFTLFLQCLDNEKDWEVLKCVLDNLPVLLQNKTLILSSRRNHVETLCSKLSAMVTDRHLGFPEKLVNVSGKFTRSDFHTYLFPVLAAMVTYHNYLDRNRQRELVKCLQFGMVSKCAKLCVTSLRLCTLEMKEVMLRLLPSVLLQLSKISATVSMAIPVLAFLSSIVRLPKMFVNFVEEEYMSVFAIALPYTNPFKFSHYTVSLAHHVIAIWFIRCRIPFRKGFVQFIQKGLKANVLQQFEENARQALQDQNQDSSDRHRSGSYSEAALRSRRRMQSGSAIIRQDVQSPVDEKMSQYHKELTETITDVMARYTFGNFSPIPHRSHTAEFLLAGGQSQTWLLGNKLITITTSGGGIKVGNSGLCEKCMATYHAREQKETKPDKPTTSRRRHRSDLQISRSHSTVVAPPPSSLDDMNVPQRSRDDMSLPLDVSGQDVAVQTGSSLSERSVLESEPLESLIFGLKASPDLKSPVMNICNCWCTNWAEVYIRAPSGNMSWMMRIENEAGISSMLESQVPDITMFFASMGGSKRKPDPTQRSRRIESGSVGEEEYETLYAQYFPQAQDKTSSLSSESEVRPGSLGFTVTCDREGNPLQHPSSPMKSPTAPKTSPAVSQETHEVSQALQIPASKDEHCPTEMGSLRRSNSSPSLLSGSSDTMSPRESGSDSAQFTWQDQKLDRLKHDYKSSDSEGGDKSDDNMEKTEICKDGKQNKHDVGKDSQKLQFSSDDPKLHNIDESNEDENEEGVDKREVGKSVAIGSELVSQSKAGEHSVDSVSKLPEYHSMLSRQLSPSPASSEASSTMDEVSDLPNLQRLRGHTVSIPASKLVPATPIGSNNEPTRVGVPPAFVFLQLYHSGALQAGNDMPMMVPKNETTERGIKLLDHIYPYETHKIGVIYVGPRQNNSEKDILSNEFGSERYAKFVQSLGTLFRLRDCDPQRVCLGGLETNGNDGEFTYGWQDESTQLIFHIATLMPNKESDPHCSNKKRHIGNDYVTIVYNDSGEDYKIGVLKGQFNYVNIVIRPLDYESNAVTLQAKEEPFQDKITTDIAEILGHKDTKVISDSNLAELVRLIAVHCNLASLVLQRQQSQPQDPFANNWLERLRSIRRIKNNLLLIDKDAQFDQHSPTRTVEDFTKYV